jgi:hypothetical protein
MPIKKNLMYRVASLHPADLEGVEHLGADEAATIRKVIKVEVSGNQIFVDLNPTPREGEAILRRHPNSPVLKAILNKYGFVSPSVIIIEDYIDFFMLRYGASHPEENVREGLLT